MTRQVLRRRHGAAALHERQDPGRRDPTAAYVVNLLAWASQDTRADIAIVAAEHGLCLPQAVVFITQRLRS